MMLEIVEITALLIVGWVAGAESGSWACVHPVISKLPNEQQIIFQKGLLKTFGRVMPVLMPLCLLLAILLCTFTADKNSTVFYLRLAATIALTSMIITTVVFNVPVNIATGTWNAKNFSTDWKKKRARWRFFQGYRSVVLILSFIILLIAQINAK